MFIQDTPEYLSDRSTFTLAELVLRPDEETAYRFFTIVLELRTNNPQIREQVFRYYGTFSRTLLCWLAILSHRLFRGLWSKV